MKKTIILFLGIAAGFSVSAQQNVPATKDLKYAASTKIQKTFPQVQQKSKTSAVIWSEDFSSGIPSGWSNVGYNGNLGSDPGAQWEYRGTSTSPNNSTGSRGAFAAGTGTIQSPTASNGWVIFDSDYLDNGGSATNIGGGLSPAPHLGTLVTPAIDLSANNFIELAFSSHARTFFGEFKVALSSDSGMTWPDTIQFHGDLSVNGSNDENEIVTADISSTLGGAQNAMISFVFDGRPGNANGNGYYYWQIDDIEIRDLPDHELRFTDAGGAPAHDIIYDNNSGGSKQGRMEDANKTPINFDSNIYNYGAKTQNNVKLVVEIYDGSSNLVTTLTSAASVTMNHGDTVDFNQFFTTNWNPGGVDDYEVVYTLSSDSIAVAQAPRDSLTVRVTEETSGLDFSNFTGQSIGTDVNLGDDGAAVANRLYFPNGARIQSFSLGFTNGTAAGGDIQLEIYDTTGFDMINGFGSAALVSQQYTITAAQAGQNQIVTFDIKPDGSTVDLTAGAYFFVVYMYSNQGANPILLANDPSINQPGFSSIMYDTGDQRWWAGFTDSDAFESPYIRVNTDFDFSIDELNVDFKAYPNPTAGEVTLELSQGGTYTVELVDMLGKVVSSEEISINGNEKINRDFSSLNDGMYLLNVSGENFTKTVKLTIK